MSITHRRGRLYQAKKRPLLYFHDRRIIRNFLPRALTDPDFKCQELTALRLEALDKIQEITSEDQITLDLQPGDMIYLNNFAVIRYIDEKLLKTMKLILGTLWGCG